MRAAILSRLIKLLELAGRWIGSAKERRRKRERKKRRRQRRRKNMKFSFSEAQRVVDEREREREKKKEQRQQCGPIFIRTSLSLSLLVSSAWRLCSFLPCAWNSSAHEWTSTPPSLIKLSSYRYSTRFFHAVPPRPSWCLAAFDSYFLKILGKIRLESAREKKSSRWNIFPDNSRI